MLSVKSNEHASKYREEGDELLSKGKFYDAFLDYNKSLCYARPGSLEISMTFERRSEAFFTIAQFQKCLGNIQAAKEHGYPTDMLASLNEREEKCVKLINEQQPDAADDPLSFFKLSHPANEKIPFIVNCLELRQCEEYGRHIITTKDLLPGDVIAIEGSHFNFIMPNAIFAKCFNCLKSNMLDLVPSSASVMFCSAKCSNEAYKNFNGKDELIKDSLSGNEIRQKMLRIMSQSLAAAGNFDELQHLVESLNGRTVFDFDFSGENRDELKKNILICVSSLMPKTDCGVAGYLRNILNMPDGSKKDVFVNFISRIVLIYMRNGVKLPGKISNLPEGGFILPFVDLINHSCDPNVYASFADNKCVLTVMKPIGPDEQIFINYRKTFMEQAKETRQLELLKTYEFTCQCTACVDNYPMPNKLRRINKSFTLPSFGRFESNRALLTELKENFKFIVENIEHHPCVETAAILIRTREIIKVLGERTSVP